MNWLFPSQKRVIPHKRWFSISLRTLHLVGIAGLAGAYLYQQPESSWYPFLLMTVISGFAMAAMEAYSDGIWLIQLRGTAIGIKLLLLSTVLWWFDQPNASIYFLCIIISGIVSHAPGRLRYYSIWHRRVITEPIQLAPGEVKDCGG
ncbi:hypothetical protein [Neptuniibacter sp.]|uniref:hypothetical protein n=1 Tax=Neptuniibacter sp. TaxID=1962643 RepID=UPI002615499A|nr:hypothetical protein [Neptuniibacter sp.]MCP4596710.1 hypothetical protein [Neptuniibacter sp.]